MAYFAWGKDMVIDNGPIDADHQKLVNMVNELHTATTDGRGHAIVGRLLDDLIRDTRDHLRREEAEMQQSGFPNLDRHKIGHDDFVNKLEQLKARYQQGSISVAAQLSSVLRDWLSLHIRRYDKELESFIRQRERAKALAAPTKRA